MTEQRAGLHPRSRAIGDLDAAEVARAVDEDAVGLTLAVEAGAAGAKATGIEWQQPCADHLRDVVGVGDHQTTFGNSRYGLASST